MTVERHAHLIALAVAVREQAMGVGVDRELNDAGSLAHGLMGQAVHLGKPTRGHTPGQTKRPAYQLDVPAEIKVVGHSQGVDEGLEHNPDMISGNKTVDLTIRPSLSFCAFGFNLPLQVLVLNLEDVPRLHHLAVWQHTSVAHLLLILNRLRKEPCIERLSLLSRSLEVIDASLRHSVETVQKVLSGAMCKGLTRC